MFENKNFQSWFKENTPKEGLSETTTFSKQFVKDAWDNGYYVGYNKAKEEMQKNGLALQSDMDKTIEQNIQLKKQNNWLEGCKLELAEHLGKANDKISELEQQIEKMKLCQNCKFEDCDYLEEPCSVCTRCLGDIKRKGNSDKWEIKE